MSDVRPFAERSDAIVTPSVAPYLRRAEDIIDLTIPRFEPMTSIEELSRVADDSLRAVGVYGEVQGSQLLRSRVAARHRVSADEVVITAGAGEALFLALGCLISAGSRVAIPRPGFPGYQAMIAFWGGVPVWYEVSARQGFSQDTILDALTPGVTAAVVNSPHNPTGSMISVDLLSLVLTRAETIGAWVLSDEAYDSMDFGSPHVSVQDIARSDASRVVLVNGVSKRLGLPSLRVGYLITRNSHLVERVTTIMLHSSRGASGLSQAVAAEALRAADVGALRARKQLLRCNADTITSAFSEAGVDTARPTGGAFTYVSDKGGRVNEPCLYESLARLGVGGLPGIVFNGSETAVRLSLLAPTATINLAANAITQLR